VTKPQGLQSIRRALLSVSDKSLIEELARALVSAGAELLATGGTAERLHRANIPFRKVEDFTGNPEAFDGRMKTLSFKLESAILFDRAKSSHLEQAKQHDIEPIDLVVCNFYPFENAVQREATEEELVSEIDVGGPTMIRAAAKNFKSVAALVDPEDYGLLMAELRQYSGSTTLELRKQLMVRAFEYTARYDQIVYEQFAQKKLRYGENPHQAAYFVPSRIKGAIDWELLDRSETELSYNNYLDLQAAFSVVRDARKLWTHGNVHSAPNSSGAVGVCAIVKHNNPCGFATGSTTQEAFERAWAGDPVSSFGGVVVLSSQFTLECARLFDQKFVEVIAAPDFEEKAIEELRRKKKKLRLLKIRTFDALATSDRFQRIAVEGGTLVQERDGGYEREEFRSVTQKTFPRELEQLARFGIIASTHVKSNAVVIVRQTEDGGMQLVATGGGQPNRIDAITSLAIPRAKAIVGRDLSSCVLVSDAFFPFADSVLAAADAGLRWVIQPGGSVKDSEVIAAADERGLGMAFTGRRHFRH